MVQCWCPLPTCIVYYLVYSTLVCSCSTVFWTHLSACHLYSCLLLESIPQLCLVLTAWKLAPHSTAPHSTLIITKQYCAAQFIMNIIIKSQLRRLIQCGYQHVECKKGNAKLMTALRTVAMSFVGQWLSTIFGWSCTTTPSDEDCLTFSKHVWL